MPWFRCRFLSKESFCLTAEAAGNAEKKQRFPFCFTVGRNQPLVIIKTQYLLGVPGGLGG
jgi:hypothetical protein